MLRLWFDKGTLLLKGEAGTPYGKWDPRVGCYRIKAYHYRDVLEYLAESKLQVKMMFRCCRHLNNSKVMLR